MTLPRISKSKYLAGLQCRLRQWWSVHEPGAAELEPDAGLLAMFESGNRVGERAREDFPGGVLIEFDPRRKREAVEATKLALAGDAPAVFEACFEQDGVFVAVDILERTATGWTLIEVKSAGSVKDAYLPDVAVQAHVLRSAGLRVERVELMHLNSDNRYPSVDDLFYRADLTEDVAEGAGGVAAEIESQRLSLADTHEPDMEPGGHCHEPHDCPFLPRCVPEGPEHPLSDLHHLGKELREDLESRGVETIQDIPADTDLKPLHLRHRAAVLSGETIVEKGLAEVLSTWEQPFAYLDFEATMPFPPCWNDCGPYTAVPVQWSVHRRKADDSLVHLAWLAEGPGDPRAALAEHLLDATREAGSVMVYSAYESRMMNSLAKAVPELEEELLDLRERLVDMLPVVRNHVYHKDFHGFSIKVVLPALVPDLSYADLEVADGLTAARFLEALLLRPESLAETDPATLREDLLAYCKRDTLAMVKLHESLIELARA